MIIYQDQSGIHLGDASPDVIRALRKGFLLYNKELICKQKYKPTIRSDKNKMI